MWICSQVSRINLLRVLSTYSDLLEEAMGNATEWDPIGMMKYLKDINARPVEDEDTLPQVSKPSCHCFTDTLLL